MREVGSYDAKTHFSSLLDEVQQGESFVITRHGRPVAVLTPPAGGQAIPVAKVIEELRTLRLGVRLGGIPIRELIEEGRR